MVARCCGRTNCSATAWSRNWTMRVVEALHVQQAARLLVDAELGPGDRLEELLVGAKAAGHGHERVGEVRHHRLALVHRAHDMEPGEALMRDLAHGERVRDDANHLAPGVEHGIGQGAHQPDMPTPVHEGQAPGDNLAAHVLGRIGVGGIPTGRRTTEHTDASHAAPSCHGRLVDGRRRCVRPGRAGPAAWDLPRPTTAQPASTPRSSPGPSDT